MWKREKKELTADQVARGVYFSSALVRDGETEAETVHEVYASDPNRKEKIARLHDVQFFRNLAAAAGYDVREIIRF